MKLREENLYIYYLYIYLCFFVCMYDLYFGPICLKFWLGNSGDPQEFSQLGFEILSWVGFIGKIAKIVIYDKARVNGGVTVSTLGNGGFSS